MIIKYKFVTEETIEVEVSDEIASIVLDSRKAEHAGNEKQRYHTAFSLNDAVYEGNIFSSGDELAERLIRQESNERCREILAHLTPLQRRRVELLMSGKTVADIARTENVAYNTVKESIEAAREKLKKLL